jgi:mannose-6-phosphate isomerase-like protein (cupin superfamily)
MGDYTAKRIDDMEAAYLGAFKRARAELGVESFGMQVMDLPPNLEGHPEHDHAETGQEEVFVVLRGGGEIEVDGERVPIDSETMVRVGPTARRKLWPGSEGMRVLALGGVPGKAYEAPDVTKLGVPDPMAA